MSLETLFEKYGLLNCDANVFLVLEKPGDFTDDQLEQRILELGDCLAKAPPPLVEEVDEEAARKAYVRGLKRQPGETHEKYIERLRRESKKEMHQGLERAAEGVKPLLSMTTSELREKVRR